jgi:parallel beta-helix repeat protein
MNYSDLKPFEFWCQKVLPLVYDDSLSYYELLCKVVDYLNKTIADVSYLHNEFVILKDFVDNYFKNLDVQQEINKKLDDMAINGFFDKLASKYLAKSIPLPINYTYIQNASVNDLLNNYLSFTNNINLIEKLSFNELYCRDGIITDNAISVINNLTNTTVVNMENNTITVANVDAFNIGDKIRIGDDEFIFATILDKHDNILILDTNIYFGVGNVVSKLTNNVILENLTFNNMKLTISNTIAYIKNCTFNNCILTLSGGIFYVENNTFNQTNSLYYKTGKSLINNNQYNNCYKSIECQLSFENKITNNVINGYSTSNAYSIGIELTNTSDHNHLGMTQNNFIAGNTINNCNYGRAGSIIGGIHLNFFACNNIISNNKSCYNSCGIYLENSCSNNVISSNICSYNLGLYGVGIELDWNCHYNVITGNICNNNKGSQTQNESCGIMGGHGASPNYCKYNSYIGNTCCNNGRAGIVIGGYYITVSDNICSNNGNGDYTDEGDIVARNSCAAVKITGNNLQSPTSILIKDNNNDFIISNNSCQNVVCVDCNDININNNNLLNITCNGNTRYSHNVIIYNNVGYSPNGKITLGKISGYFVGINRSNINDDFVYETDDLNKPINWSKDFSS